jgi:FMN phosphatase YigB (HAD superfamily)
MDDSSNLQNVRAVLFDLDGTLLQVEMHEFVPAYLRGLAACFDDLAGRGSFVETVLTSTQALLEREEGPQTNEELFLAALHRRLGIPPSIFTQRLEHFCRNGLQRLAPLVHPLPLARRILESCLARGLEVALATNPVFPRPVVEARLKWAKLIDFPFRLITCTDNCHFCKPHPGYFREVLARLGLAPHEVVMVGNDTERDLGARQSGIAAFLVDTCLADRLNGYFTADFRGDHAALLRFIEGLGGSGNN